MTLVLNDPRHSWVALSVTVIIVRSEFKSLTGQFAFPFALILHTKTWIHLFSSQLWLNSRAHWIPYLWFGNYTRRKKSLNLTSFTSLTKLTLCEIRPFAEGLGKFVLTHASCKIIVIKRFIKTLDNYSYLNHDLFVYFIVYYRLTSCLQLTQRKEDNSLPAGRAGPQDYTPYLHRAAVCRFDLVTLLLLGHVKGSIGVHHLWAHPYFSSSVLHVWLCK